MQPPAGCSPGHDLQCWNREKPGPVFEVRFPAESLRNFNNRARSWTRARRGPAGYRSSPRGLTAPRGGVLRAGFSGCGADDHGPRDHSRRPGETVSAAFRGDPPTAGSGIGVASRGCLAGPGLPDRPGDTPPQTCPGRRNTAASNGPRGLGLTCRLGSGTPTLGAHKPGLRRQWNETETETTQAAALSCVS